MTTFILGEFNSLVQSNLVSKVEIRNNLRYADDTVLLANPKKYLILKLTSYEKNLVYIQI